ncbi:alkylhydroperoxidase domain protein [Pseudactinotalea sp. Z1732]|uniref:alkylhydroperoxidase domain protein n=1 Tax=Pseudactinotalea sp. Z1732 TaxID=3413026 RepID=UPI003C7D0655
MTRTHAAEQAEPAGPPAGSGAADLVDRVLGITPGDELDRLRAARAQAREHTQRSYQVLFEPVDVTAVSVIERFAVAAFTVTLHLRTGAPGAVRALAAHYTGSLQHLEPGLAGAVITRAEAARARGPYGAYAEPGLAQESTTGPVYRIEADPAADTSARVRAGLEHAHLLTFRPREAGPADLQRLLDAGWSTDGIVTLSQLISFLAYQVRLVHGLSYLGGAGGSGAPDHGGGLDGVTAPQGASGATKGAKVDAADTAGHSGGDRVRTHPGGTGPTAFTRDQLGWLPWLAPLTADDLTERHHHGLVDAARARSEYFMLLARDPEALGARTRTDKDIFHNTDGGLPRAERELAATVASRVNGCVFCASVHARFAAHYGKDVDAVQRLLDEGTDADLGPRWNVLTAAAAALTRTPADFGGVHLESLRAAGLIDAEIVDLVSATAFFNWANRLMLSLGQPALPA